MSSDYYTSTGLILYMCPHTTRYLVVSYRYMYVSGEGEFGVQTVHDASMDPPVPTWYLPVPQAVHDASPDPPLPTRYLPATQNGRRWEWDGEDTLSRLPVFNGCLLCSDRCVHCDSFVQTARCDGGTSDQCLGQWLSLWQQKNRDWRPHLCSVPTWKSQE